MRRDHGFALLIVLWTMVLLALVVTRLTASGHVEAQLAANLRAAAAVEAAADGATYETIFHLIDPGSGHWSAPDRRAIRLAEAVADVRIESLAGRINPNIASYDLLRALLLTVGVDAQQAARLAAAIIDWRSPGIRPRPNGAKAPQYRAAGLSYGPPGAPFQDVPELANVLGMTPEILNRIAPHMTVWWQSDAVPALADPVVLRALRAAGGAVDDASADDGNPVYAITTTAVARSGARFTRSAVVEIGPSDDGRRFKVLSWSRAT